MTSFAIAVGYQLQGNVVVESVFSWPGLGRELVNAVSASDYPLAQGAFLMIAVVVDPDEPDRRPALRPARSEDRRMPELATVRNPALPSALSSARLRLPLNDPFAVFGLAVYAVFLLMAIFRRPDRAVRPDGDPLHAGI